MVVDGQLISKTGDCLKKVILHHLLVCFVTLYPFARCLDQFFDVFEAGQSKIIFSPFRMAAEDRRTLSSKK